MKRVVRRLCLLGLVVLAAPAGAAAQAGAPAPDLAVVALEVDPAAPAPQEVATVEVAVENVGTAAAGPFAVVLDAEARLRKLVPGLAPGARTAVRFSWFAPAGEHTLTVTADPEGAVGDADRSNNTLTRTVRVAPPLLPDLVVESLAVRPEFPKPEEAAELAVVVGNAGTLTTVARAVLRVRDDFGVVATLFVDRLAPVQTEAFVVAWTPHEGERRLRAEVDALSRVAELREDNNARSRLVTVTARPATGADLVVDELVADPGGPGTGTISARVANAGSGEPGAFVVAFELNGAELAAVPVDALGPGQSQTVSASWTAGGAGEALVRVKADARGQVAEAQEDDNVAVTFVSLGAPSDACAQPVWLNLEEAAAEILASVLSLSLEEVRHVFLPRVKRAMQTDFAGINLRVLLNRPTGVHSRLNFIADPPGDNRLGEAPLDLDNHNRGDAGRVYVSQFEAGLSRGQAFRRDLDGLAQALAKVASHEAGHFLGLGHDDVTTTARYGGENLMAPSVETFTSALFGDARFTDENLEYLRGILPLTCK